MKTTKTYQELNEQLSEEIQAMKNPVFETILGQVPFEETEINEEILEETLKEYDTRPTQS